jgi:hypothetical protein
MTRKVHWVSCSKDVKTGEVVASYSPKETCPDSCTLKAGGCYAWGLFYINILGKKIADNKITLKSLKDALNERKPTCRIVRHRIAGDIVDDVKETLKECKTIEKLNLINIGYTHDWRNKKAQPMKKYFRASCQSEEEVIEARNMGWAATLIISDNSKKKILSNGETAVICPARHGVVGKKDITCNQCTLCKVNDKTVNKTVMFQVHGRKSTINKAKQNLK